MKKSVQTIMSIFLSSIMAISCVTTGAKVTTNSENEGNVELSVQSSSGNVLKATKDNVKLIGRTLNNKGDLWLAQSGSGIEFNVSAKSLTIQFGGDASARPTRGTTPIYYARYAIYVDGVEQEVGSMDKNKKQVVIFNGDETKTSTVKIIKITESAQSLMCIKSIILDQDGTISPTEQKKLKIEIIGDSITCGYGVEAPNQLSTFTTQTENVTKAYGYLTAQALDADYSMVSYSGYGIISGFTGNGKINTASLLPPIYENFCFAYGFAQFNNEKWDFSQFVPNIIVINLGTNDDSYVKNDSSKSEDFVKAYVEFIKKIRKLNPKAHIICSLGIMGDALFTSVEQAAYLYTEDTNDTNISTLHFKVQNSIMDGLGADWHPSERTQKKESQLLISHIKSILNNQ